MEPASQIEESDFVRVSPSHSSPYPTLTNVFTLLNIVLAPIATVPAFLDIESG